MTVAMVLISGALTAVIMTVCVMATMTKQTRQSAEASSWTSLNHAMSDRIETLSRALEDQRQLMVQPPMMAIETYVAAVELECDHSERVDVRLANGELVAELCLLCDEQLDIEQTWPTLPDYHRVMNGRQNSRPTWLQTEEIWM